MESAAAVRNGRLYFWARMRVRPAGIDGSAAGSLFICEPIPAGATPPDKGEVLAFPAGTRVAVAHGGSDGVLEDYYPWINKKLDVIICCNSKQVKARNPHRRIMGNWDCPSYTGWADGVWSEATWVWMEQQQVDGTPQSAVLRGKYVKE